jgi:hypothetical protein
MQEREAAKCLWFPAIFLPLSNGLPLRQNITTSVTTHLHRVLKSGKYTRIFSMPSVRLNALFIQYGGLAV